MSQMPTEKDKSDKDDGLFAPSSPVYVSPSSPVSSPSSPSFFSFDKARQEREWRKSLAKLEKEIETLQATLTIKSQEVAELKRKLGITKVDELKDGILHGYNLLKESETVKKTNAALKTVGDFASRKFSDFRNSTAVKLVGGRVEDAYTSVREKLSSVTSEDGINEVSQVEASAPLEDEEDKAFGERVQL